MLQFNIRNKLSIIVSNDYLTPFYDKNDNTIIIPDTKIDYEELASFILKYPFSDLRILSTSLINNKVLEAIRDNNNIVFIKLGSITDPYTLTRKVFDLLNASLSLYSIDTQNVIGSYSTREMNYIAFFSNVYVERYKIIDILTEDNLTFYNDLSDEEIKYLLLYCKKGININFNFDNYENILKVIEKLQGKNISFFVIESKALLAYSRMFLDLTQKGEEIRLQNSQSLRDYLAINSLLELMVRDIKEANLSSYEKFLAVFQIVTHFKPYQKSIHNKAEVRELEYILFNHYIVCGGFVNLFIALLDMVGIKGEMVEVTYYKEKEGISLEEEATFSKEELDVMEGNVAYHARLLVRLVDPKYGIDGIFISDPTWDNDLEEHYFNHSLMTFYEMGLENKDFYESDLDIFRVSSAEEFLNIIKKRPYAKKFFVSVIKKIDYEYYKYLQKNFDIDSYEFLLEIYNYIISKTKRVVNKETKYRALKEVFDIVFKDTRLEVKESFMKELERENEQREELYFKKGR